MALRSLALALLLAVPACAGNAAAPEPAPRITFRFLNVDIADVLRFLEEATGKQGIQDPAVRATVTVRTQGPVPLGTAVDTLQKVLGLKGLILAETNEAFIVTRR
jgi:type II secretory pathway component GspD/PulD (secretin)